MRSTHRSTTTMSDDSVTSCVTCPERVQFVFITHNKNTMELASHLVGVTMGEPGVSRLVAVDVDEAVRMAAVG